MCRSLRLGMAGLTCVGLLGLEPIASADGGVDAGADAGPATMTPGAILAHYCGDAKMQCMTAPLSYEYTHDLAPWLPDWDTGWIPENFDELQVRFVLEIPADTEVNMSGNFKATWPDPLTIATPGNRSSGFLKVDYGLIAQAIGKIDITVAGYHVDWQGPIPFVPQVDFHLLGMEQFDAWAYDPNPVSVSAWTPQMELFRINVLSLANIPEQVAEGGVALQVRGEMQATYKTERMVIDPAIAPIMTETGTTLHDFVGGAYVEIDVHPEGRVSYAGVIHLIPAFYVKVLGHDFTIPVYDYELNITELLDLDLASQIKFDTLRVHVPLPDIPKFEEPAVVDFGDVAVGSGKRLSIAIPNDGEAEARASGEVEVGMKSTFQVLSPNAHVAPGEEGEMELRFLPQAMGKFEAEMTIRSNDPDLPEQIVLLRGNALDPDDPRLPPEDGNTGPGNSDDGLAGYDSAGDDGGCSCRTAQIHQSAPLQTTLCLTMLGLTGLGLSRRRRRSMSVQKRV